MGISSLPSPSEGMLCIILVNTVTSISIVKGIVQTILYILGIRISTSSSSSSTSSSDSTENNNNNNNNNSETSIEFRLNPSESYLDEFKRRTPSVRFDSVCSCEQTEQHECSVCLTQFEPESEINQLSCGHLFHKGCLEKWLEYWNITCPNCRTSLVPEEDITSSCFW